MPRNEPPIGTERTGVAGARQSPRAPVRGLVARIGGQERLYAILDEFYRRLAADPIVGFFFAGRDLAAIVAGQHAFLMWATGASADLRARHPRVAHRALPPIRRGQFDRRLVLLRATLEDVGIAPEDVAAWLRLEESMRGSVQMRGS